MIESRYIARIGCILQSVPRPIHVAWERYREAQSMSKVIEQDARARLEWECWQQGMRGYYPVGGWLIGWVGHQGDRRFQVIPDRAGLQPTTDLERVWFKQKYGYDHAHFCNEERVVV